MSTGLKANNDGSAAIQVGGTDYITISSAGAVAIPVSLTVGGIPAGGNYDLVRYTSPSTWDATAAKAAGLKAIKVTVIGAGGAGGGPITTSSGAAGGGGGGGVAIEYVPVANITPGNKTVTAGAGTNSFGPWGTATPNSPTATTSATAGATGAAVTGANYALGGAGGVGSGGSLNGGGGTGEKGNYAGGGGIGGSSMLGGGGQAGIVAADGGAGTGYGGGGGGAYQVAPSPTKVGGAGAPGVVIIEEFF